MDLHRTGHEHEIRPELPQLFAQSRTDILTESAIAKSEEHDLRCTEHRNATAYLFLARIRVAGLRSVGGNHDAHGTMLAQMLGDDSPAADHLIVRMGCEHE